MVNEAPLSGDACDSSASPGSPAENAGTIPGAAPGKALSPEAERALLEAEARRQAAAAAALPPEINGRGGEEPTRYGDWERKGLAVDF
jgi:hypothetical protein